MAVELADGMVEFGGGGPSVELGAELEEPSVVEADEDGGDPDGEPEAPEELGEPDPLPESEELGGCPEPVGEGDGFDEGPGEAGGDGGGDAGGPSRRKIECA